MDRQDKSVAASDLSRLPCLFSLIFLSIFFLCSSICWVTKLLCSSNWALAVSRILLLAFISLVHSMAMLAFRMRAYRRMGVIDRGYLFARGVLGVSFAHMVFRMD